MPKVAVKTKSVSVVKTRPASALKLSKKPSVKADIKVDKKVDKKVDIKVDEMTELQKEVKEKTPKKVLSMEELLRQNPITPPKKGKIIDAKIIELSKKGILFDIGWKSYAVLGNIEAQQLGTYLPYLKDGDIVPVKIVVEEAKDGFPVVSMQSFFEKGKWNILETKFKSEEEIEVMCGEYGKGGVFIDFMGIRGVIPKIQITEEYIRNPEKLIGQKIKVKVLEVDREKNRLVVSQKASVLGISYKEITGKFNEIKEGEIYKAKVIGFSDFGVFCEVNMIEGLIHISEISWEKVVDPKKYFKVGKTIDVVVVEKNPENLKLNLSIKRLAHDPWIGIEARYPMDKVIQGEIVRKEKYGYIVRLEPGVEGLIHVSKVTGAEGENLDIDKNVPVYIEKIDTKNRRISLILTRFDKPVAYR